MEFFKYRHSLDFMKRANFAIAISMILSIAAYILIGTKGLNYGIDFQGGTIIQVKYKQEAPIQKMRELLGTNHLYDGAEISKFGADDEVIIRMKSSSSSVGKDIGDFTREMLKPTGDFEIRRVDMVGPAVGSELRTKGITALLLAVLGILIYVAFRFEWRFAVASVIALVHDISIAIGFIIFFNVEVNLDVLAALLTLLGYSLNDTIIIFDRIREGIEGSNETSFKEVINDSITRTLSRTVLTSLMTFLVVFTLYMFGGEIIHPFSYTMLIGVVIGTYSSIFVAAPMLIWFGFDVQNYREKLANKTKREIEKEKMRSQFEGGIV